MFILQTDGSSAMFPLIIQLILVVNKRLCRLVQCAEEQKHVSESLYPFTYNPKMSLTLSQVPNSTQRSPPFTRTQLKDITEVKDDKVDVNI